MCDLETVYKLYNGKKQRGYPTMAVRKDALSFQFIPAVGFSAIMDKIKKWKSTKAIIREIYLDDQGITFVEQSVAKLKSQEEANDQ
jgi:hypothetical protein